MLSAPWDSAESMHWASDRDAGAGGSCAAAGINERRKKITAAGSDRTSGLFLGIDFFLEKVLEPQEHAHRRLAVGFGNALEEPLHHVLCLLLDSREGRPA